MEINLRPFLEKDIEILYNIRNDFDLQFLLLTHPKPNTYKRTVDWIENKTQDDDTVFFVISNKMNDTIGFIQATKMDFINRFCYVGIVVAKSWQSKGVFALAIEIFEKYLSGTLGIRKLIAEIATENILSVKAFKSAGYKEVGIFKEHFYCNSKFRDVSIIEKIL